MALLKRSLLIGTGFISTLMLMGFTGQEQYIELQGSFYGRDSAKFRSIDQNIQSVLATGTRGEILSHKLMSSGNYGLEVKVLSGASAGKTLWVYYNLRNPDMALYEKAPQNWGEGSVVARAPSVEKARGMKTLRETPAFKAPARTAEKARPSVPRASLAADSPALRNSLHAISRSNEVVRSAGTPPCVNCSLSTDSGQPLSLRRASRAMAPSCSAIMSPQGQMGSTGRAIFSMMAEPNYRSFYLRNDALGGFCPKFRYLTPTQKLQAWTWFWASLGQEESSCNPHLRHPTTYRDGRGRLAILNPREGYGMWAMEKDANVRASRGSACRNIGSAEGQARCSIDIMTRTQLARGRNADVHVGSYWGPVMRGNKQIMPHMRRLNLCF